MLTDEEIEGILRRLIPLLVIEGHRQIVNTDLKNVLEDAITEQFNWNRQASKTKEKDF
jgi:hypothetical protein